MKIPLDIEVTMKDGTLILTSRVNGNTIIFAKDHIVQKKIQMVTLGELSGFTIEQIAKLFGYKTRKTYYDIRRHMMANEIQELLPKSTGPKKPRKRTPELEKRVIQLRLTTDKDMYEITRILNREGFKVKSRLIGQILSDFGITKKKVIR